MTTRKARAIAPVNNECLEGLVPLRAGNFELAWDPKAERLIVSIDCRAGARMAAHPSGSGKTRVLATTSGFIAVPVPGFTGLKVQLTATLPVA